jgi:hypothetical protein
MWVPEGKLSALRHSQVQSLRDVVSVWPIDKLVNDNDHFLLEEMDGSVKPSCLGKCCFKSFLSRQMSSLLSCLKD